MKTRAKTYLIISGILMIAAGIIVLCNPVETLVSFAWLVGLCLLFNGVMTLLLYIDEVRGRLGSGGVLFEAITSILLGLMFIFNDVLVASIVPYLLALWAIFAGIGMMVHCTDLKWMGVSKWWLELVLGIACVVFGILSCVEPVVATVAISVFVGLAFILYGLGTLFLLYGLDRVKKRIDEIIIDL